MTIVLWIVVFLAFLLFVPLRHRDDRLPAATFLAGGLVFAVSAPAQAGGGSLVFSIAILVGGSLIVAGWARIRNDVWIRDENTGRLVTEGIYRVIRHPQYSGYLVISLGALIERTTIPLSLLWPLLSFLYYRLARLEERDLEEAFGIEWRRYAARTGFFFPWL